MSMTCFLTWSLLSPDPYAIVRETSLNWLENISDIIAHVSAFSLVTALFLGWFPLTDREIPSHFVYGIIAYCLILELLQTFVPGRHCDTKDAMSNLSGFIVGFGFVRLISSMRMGSRSFPQLSHSRGTDFPQD
jgi:VanZ family protein